MITWLLEPGSHDSFEPCPFSRWLDRASGLYPIPTRIQQVTDQFVVYYPLVCSESSEPVSAGLTPQGRRSLSKKRPLQLAELEIEVDEFLSFQNHHAWRLAAEIGPRRHQPFRVNLGDGVVKH